MDRVEFLVIIPIITTFSIYSILGARHRITKVPWFTFLRYPQYFGGWGALFHNLLWLAAWVLLSNLLIILFCSIVVSFQVPVKALYNWIGYTSPSGGKVGLATLTLFSIAAYWHLVKKTHRIAIGKSRYMPKDKIEADSEELNKDELHPKKGRFQNNKNLLRAMFYFFPDIMAPIYGHFYWSTQGYIAGCTDLLIAKCGDDILLGFFREFVEESQEEELRWVQERLVEERDNSEQVRPAVEMLVRALGYYETKQHLERYIKSKANIDCGDDNRHAIRIALPKSVRIQYSHAGKKSKGKIIECSKDGRGLYLSVNHPLDVNKPIRVKLSGNEVEARIVHRNARFHGNRIVCGAGLALIRKCDFGKFKSVLPLAGQRSNRVV
ncbi:MAG: hypothetical protein P8103_15610 [Candidatus Thiodiazotropha sp.]